MFANVQSRNLAESIGHLLCLVPLKRRYVKLDSHFYKHLKNLKEINIRLHFETINPHVFFKFIFIANRGLEHWLKLIFFKNFFNKHENEKRKPQIDYKAKDL